jgi:hypothetical protein
MKIIAAESCESLNSENPDSDKKRQIEMRPTTEAGRNS